MHYFNVLQNFLKKRFMITANTTYKMMKMKICEECGKKLRLLEGYRHPTLGKDYTLCSPCFDQVSESVARWGEFVLANSFDMRSPRNNIPLDWKKIIPNITKIRDSLENELIEKEIDIKR